MHSKADTTYAITLLQSKDCSLFVFYGDAGRFISVTDDKWKGR